MSGKSRRPGILDPISSASLSSSDSVLPIHFQQTHGTQATHNGSRSDGLRPPFSSHGMNGNSSSSILPPAAVQQLLNLTSGLLGGNAGPAAQAPPPPTLQSDAKPANPLNRCRCVMCVDPGRAGQGPPSYHLCHYPDCGRKYKKTSHLRAHLRGHVGDAPFACSWSGCSKSFKRSDELQRHVRTHTGEKNHECSFCKKRFGRSDHLKKHMHSHLALKQATPTPPPERAAVMATAVATAAAAAQFSHRAPAEVTAAAHYAQNYYLNQQAGANNPTVKLYNT